MRFRQRDEPGHIALRAFRDTDIKPQGVVWITDPLERAIQQRRAIHLSAAAINEDNPVAVPIAFAKLLEKGEKSPVTATAQPAIP
tara:strand:+ start:755 stop:1009 length:255 start_codon:yes stop_codon:yes gene_type:complete